MIDGRFSDDNEERGWMRGKEACSHTLPVSEALFAALSISSVCKLGPLGQAQPQIAIARIRKIERKRISWISGGNRIIQINAFQDHLLS